MEMKKHFLHIKVNKHISQNVKCHIYSMWLYCDSYSQWQSLQGCVCVCCITKFNIRGWDGVTVIFVNHVTKMIECCFGCFSFVVFVILNDDGLCWDLGGVVSLYLLCQAFKERGPPGSWAVFTLCHLSNWHYVWPVCFYFWIQPIVHGLNS